MRRLLVHAELLALDQADRVLADESKALSRRYVARSDPTSPMTAWACTLVED